MKACIYCRSELQTDVAPEHVIPQGFGVFTPDLTLDCVCSACNGYFGSKLEWPMRVESIEGALRLQFGLKGTVGSIGTKGVTPTVSEGEDWKGARTTIRTDENGTQRTDVLPQIGARRTSSEPFEWCLGHELTADFAERFPKGSEFRIVGGQTTEENDRLLQRLIAVCPTFVYGGTKAPPFSDDGKVALRVESQMSRPVARCLCKIAFNYMALTCGETFALSRELDDIRDFIRNDVGDQARRIFARAKPIIAQEIITGEHRLYGHV